MSILLKKGEIKKLKCFRCRRIFERLIYPNMKRGRTGARPFCSRECLFINGHSGTKRVPRQRRKCGYCEKIMFVGPWTIRRGKGKFCSAYCRIASVTMDRTVASDGYYLVLREGKRVREHRWVVEQKLARKLRSDEDVHHVNFDKLDNRPENLFVCKKTQHGRIHAELEKLLNVFFKLGMVQFEEGSYSPVLREAHVRAE